MLAGVVTETSHCFQKCNRNSGHRFWSNCLLKVLSRSLHIHTKLARAKVSGEWWQLVTLAHDEGDRLTLCEWHSQVYDCISFLLCLFWFALNWCNGCLATSHNLFWDSLCNSYDINASGMHWSFYSLDCILYSNFEEKKVLVHPYFNGDIFYVL